jgi:hypothetical protein
MNKQIEARLDLIHTNIEHLIEGAHLMANCIADQLARIDTLNERVTALAPVVESDGLLASALQRLNENDASLKRVANDLARLLEVAHALRGVSSAKVSGT